MTHRWAISGARSTSFGPRPRRPASRRSHPSLCCVILCLDCRRIALIGRCLVKKKDFDWYMPIEFKDFDWYMFVF